MTVANSGSVGRGKSFKEFLTEGFTYDVATIERLWSAFNDVSFDGTLTKPKILVEPDLDHLAYKPVDNATMEILGFCDEDPETHEIVLLFSAGMTSASELVGVVGHEMVHQALADQFGYHQMLKIGHGKEFEEYTGRIAKYHNTKLSGKSID